MDNRLRKRILETKEIIKLYQKGESTKMLLKKDVKKE